MEVPQVAKFQLWLGSTALIFRVEILYLGNIITSKTPRLISNIITSNNLPHTLIQHIPQNISLFPGVLDAMGAGRPQVCEFSSLLGERGTCPPHTNPPSLLQGRLWAALSPPEQHSIQSIGGLLQQSLSLFKLRVNSLAGGITMKAERIAKEFSVKMKLTTKLI